MPSLQWENIAVVNAYRYTDPMTRRTTIEVDEALLVAAQRVLGTTGLKDTVDGALTAVVRAERRRRLAERLKTGSGVDLGADITTRARTWRGA
jgi:Arc/MetJ family transcription regulator